MIEDVAEVARWAKGIEGVQQGLFILPSFPRMRESIWFCPEKVAIGHGHGGSRFRGKDETHLTCSGK